MEKEAHINKCVSSLQMSIVYAIPCSLGYLECRLCIGETKGSDRLVEARPRKPLNKHQDKDWKTMEHFEQISGIIKIVLGRIILVQN